MAQLVASVTGVVLGGVAEVVSSNLAKCKIFTASIVSVDSLYPSVYIRGVIRKFAENSCHFYIVRTIELELQHTILQHICK